jgi:hypothetical protein
VVAKVGAGQKERLEDWQKSWWAEKGEDALKEEGSKVDRAIFDTWQIEPMILRDMKKVSWTIKKKGKYRRSQGT